jgi:hypothetical protein
MTDRVLAGVGVVAVVAALVIIWVARVGIPRDVYVSELGADGMPTARWFQVALVTLVVGGTLIAVAARRIRAAVRVLGAWAPTATLLVACALFLLASQVPCTSGCPVPYGPLFTWQDFTHTTSAVIAFAAAAWAMLQCSFAAGHRVLRRFSLLASLSVATIAGAGGLMSLFNWNAGFGSHLEFVATTIGIAWIAALGLFLAVSPSATHGGEELVREPDESRDLDVVTVDPPALGL